MSGTLITRLDSLGDMLLTGPAVRAAADLPGPVTVVCGPSGRPAARLLPGIDALLVLHTSWIDARPPAVSRPEIDALVDRIAAIAPDRAAILGSFHQSPLPTALLLRLAGVPEIAAISVDYAGTLLDHRLPDPGDVHEVERNLGVVRALGARGDPADTPLRVRRDPSARPPALPDDGYVVVHPGASVPARAWDPARHRDLVRRLVADGRAVVVSGGPDETALTAYVSDDGTTALDLGGRTDVPGLVETLAGAQAVVVGNTGPAHLAAAVGTPIASLFAPTVPSARWRPWGVPHVLLTRPMPCAGCRARRCPIAGHPCLDDVSVSEVIDAVQRLAPATGSSAAASRPAPYLEVPR